MEFIKERNFIVAYYCGEKQGAWNIISGQFIGKSGKPVKSVPSCFTYNNLPSYLVKENQNILAYAITWYRRGYCGNYNYNIYDSHCGENLERLLSVGLFPNGHYTLTQDIILNKDIINYCKTELNYNYDSVRVQRYLAEIKFKQYYNTLPNWAKDVFTSLITKNIPYDYLKTILNRIISERADMLYTGYNKTHEIANLIENYYNISITLYGKVEVEKNILTKYAILKYLEQEYKNTHYNEILKKKNDKAWLYYENETFIVKPILTKEDFHNEGERQHNCVERLYMEKVYEGSTHVVTVRRKSDPDTNYITCEVSNNGTIIQYLAAFNRSVTDNDAINFKREYAIYLKNSRN